MKTTIRKMMLMAVLTLVWGCSSDSDNNTSNSTFVASEAPNWKIDWTSNDSRPTWTEPNPSLFESSMIIMVKLQDELVPYCTKEDLMAVFINNECRAISKPDGDDKDIYFILNIHGNGTDREVRFTLNYYCASLKQLFTVSEVGTFRAEKNYGTETDFIVHILKGSTKYPVQSPLQVALPEQKPFETTSNDLIAAFVGNDCRGVCKPGETLTVYSPQAGETVQLRYYSEQKKGIYTSPKTIQVTGESQNVMMEF